MPTEHIIIIVLALLLLTTLGVLAVYVRRYRETRKENGRYQIVIGNAAARMRQEGDRKAA